MQVFFARLARSCTKSCESCTKNEAFLARYEESWKNLARKICSIIFLRDFDQILQEIYLTVFLARKVFIFSARLVRYVQDLVQDLVGHARKILTRFAYFLKDGFYWANTKTTQKCFYSSCDEEYGDSQILKIGVAMAKLAAFVKSL